MRKGIYRPTAVLIGALAMTNVGASPWQLSINLGAAQYEMGSSTYQITTTETDTLRQTQNPWVGIVSMGVSYIVPKASLPELWLGLNYRHTCHNIFNHSTTGQVAQYQDSNLENYTYSLGVINNRAMIDLTLPVALTQNISLFAISGIGYGRTSLKYSDVPNEGIYAGNLVLATQYKSAFIPEAGIGFLYQYTNNIKISLQYLYTWLGTMNTSMTGSLSGVHTELITPARFSLNNNAVLFGLYFAI